MHLPSPPNNFWKFYIFKSNFMIKPHFAFEKEVISLLRDSIRRFWWSLFHFWISAKHLVNYTLLNYKKAWNLQERS